MANQPQRAREEETSPNDADETVAADGGEETADGGAPEQPALEALFVSLTGVEEVVEEQATDRGDHRTDADTDEIAAGARAAATDDGLRDTIDDAEPPDGQAHGGEP